MSSTSAVAITWVGLVVQREKREGQSSFYACAQRAAELQLAILYTLLHQEQGGAKANKTVRYIQLLLSWGKGSTGRVFMRNFVFRACNGVSRRFFSVTSKGVWGNHQDVIIVGGGIMGLSSAFHLARRMPGRDICVIERDSTVRCYGTVQ